MGLDMYLNGERWLTQCDGPRLPIKETYRLATWRKHPNLHGFIVQNFADGHDDCREILLDAFSVETILKAINDNRLPPTDGFIFGKSDGSEKSRDLVLFQAALDWLNTADEDSYRSLVYRASW